MVLSTPITLTGRDGEIPDGKPVILYTRWQQPCIVFSFARLCQVHKKRDAIASLDQA
jgi:hypothetical protein